MTSKERPLSNRRFIAVVFMFALAVTISIALATGAKAAYSPIVNAEYIPASEVIELDANSSALVSSFMDEINPLTGLYELNQFDPWCEWPFETDTADDSSYGENFLISTNDRLIITRKDGTRETLSPRYENFGVNSGEFMVFMAWVNEENRITDVATCFEWKNEPKEIKNNFFNAFTYKKGTYDNTVTVNVVDADITRRNLVPSGAKSLSTTFKKTIKVTGDDLTKYDKNIPKINYKKFGLGEGYAGDRYGCNFGITWPKVKNAVYYGVKIKQIYPVGDINVGGPFSGKYKTATDYIRTKKPELIGADYEEEYDGPGYLHTDCWDSKVLSSDTMWQFKVLAIKKSDPEKTGAIFAYGPYSKQVNLFLSKNKTFKAKGKKKSVKLTWNKIGKATGYKIKYSKNKNMSKAKTITVKGAGRTTYTVKKLKKKTKYYFEITPYKTYKKVTYNGFTSAKKAAKTK